MKIVIIAGMSAVGKKTLIRRILDGDVKLQNRFGVTGQTYATGYSFNEFSFGEAQRSDTVLVQWQTGTHSHISALRKWFPEAEFKTYFLFRNWDEHFKSHVACEHNWQPQNVAELKEVTLRMLYSYFLNHGPIELVTIEQNKESLP